MYSVKESDVLRRAAYWYFDWSRSLATAKKFVLAVGMACVTGLAAQIKINLPWTPVPITLQTFFVLLSGVLLGRKWGGISQIIYVGAGIAGVPWFTGRIGGYGAIFGPTGGYLIGFILCAFFLGYVIDKYVKSRSFVNILLLMLFANFSLIYIPGLIQLGLYFHLINGAFPGLYPLLAMGFLPFVAGDLIKVILASSVACGILPKNSDSSI
jgi:biotin transport system substrate-specific component